MPPLFAETDWTAAGVGAAVALVAGSVGGWYLKIYSARADREDKRVQLAAEADRVQRKDTIAELYEILAVQRKDREDDRKLIHDLRGEQQITNTRLALCEYDREQLRFEVEDLRKSVEEAGITVQYRQHQAGHYPKPDPSPVVPHGPDSPGEGVV